MPMSEQHETAAPHCVKCGYNLTGLPDRGRCPECGNSFDAARREPEPQKPALLISFLGPPTLIGVGTLLGLYGTSIVALVWIVINAVTMATWQARWTRFDAIRRRKPPLSSALVLAQAVALAIVLVIVQAIVCAMVLFCMQPAAYRWW
jgi:hypothetical protein